MDREKLIEHRFQRYTAIRCLIKKGFAVFARPGLGKTIIALRAIQLWQSKKVLIVAPKKVIENTWPQEIEKWDKFEGITYNIKRKEYRQREALIDLINPEALKNIRPGDYDTVIADESSMFKNIRSKRFKQLLKIAKKAKYRLVLTGTPRPHSYLDLYPQMYLADLGASLGKSFTAFRSKYFNTIPVRYGTDRVFNTYEIKKGAEEEIQKAIADRSISLDTKGLVEMPELNIVDLRVKMTKGEQAQYDQMEKELFALVHGHEIFSHSAGSCYSKCHQLANGAIYTDEIARKNRAYAVLHDHKIERLKNLIDELNGSPLLIGYLYDSDARRILEAIPSAETMKSDSVERWNSGKISCLLLQYRAAAYGLNLQSGGSDLALFSLTDNWADYDQLICRIYRQGAKKKVFVHRIITERTVDEVIVSRLDKHQTGNQGLIGALQAYRWIKRN